MKITFTLPRATSSEKSIIELLNQLTSTDDITLDYIAKKSYTSIASVNRTIKKLGFVNIYELKYMIKNDSNNPTDNVSRNLYKSILEFHRTIDWGKVALTAEMIANSRSVICFGSKRAQVLAQEFAWDLNAIGIRATHNSLHQDLVVFLDNETTVVVFSTKDHDKEATKFIKESAFRGSKVVSISCERFTEWKQNSDVCFHVPFNSTNTKLDAYVEIGAFTHIRMLNYHLLEAVLNNKEYKT